MSEHQTPSPHPDPGPTPPLTFTRAVLDRLQLNPCAAPRTQLIEESDGDTSPESLIAQHLQQSEVVRRENLWLLERTYQNSCERWDLLTQDIRLWLQQRGDTLFDSLAPDAQTPSPSQSLSPDPTGAPR